MYLSRGFSAAGAASRAQSAASRVLTTSTRCHCNPRQVAEPRALASLEIHEARRANKNPKALSQNGYFAKDISEVKNKVENTGVKKNRGGKYSRIKEIGYKFHTGVVVNKAGESMTTIPRSLLTCERTYMPATYVGMCPYGHMPVGICRHVSVLKYMPAYVAMPACSIYAAYVLVSARSV